MWNALARFLLRYGYVLLAVLVLLTALLGWEASQVKLSYEFTRAIPTDNPKYVAYQAFRKKFGEDGNLLVIGVRTSDLFRQDVFNDYALLARNVRASSGVTDVVSLPGAVDVQRSDSSETLQARPLFPARQLSQPEIDSAKQLFFHFHFTGDCSISRRPMPGSWACASMDGCWLQRNARS